MRADGEPAALRRGGHLPSEHNSRSMRFSAIIDEPETESPGPTDSQGRVESSKKIARAPRNPGCPRRSQGIAEPSAPIVVPAGDEVRPVIHRRVAVGIVTIGACRAVIAGAIVAGAPVERGAAGIKTLRQTGCFFPAHRVDGDRFRQVEFDQCFSRNPNPGSRRSCRGCRAGARTYTGANGCSFTTTHHAADNRADQGAANHVAGGRLAFARTSNLELIAAKLVVLPAEVKRGEPKRQFRASGQLARSLGLGDDSVNGGAARNSQNSPENHVLNHCELNRGAFFSPSAFQRLVGPELDQGSLGNGYWTFG